MAVVCLGRREACGVTPRAARARRGNRAADARRGGGRPRGGAALRQARLRRVPPDGGYGDPGGRSAAREQQDRPRRSHVRLASSSTGPPGTGHRQWPVVQRRDAGLGVFAER